jgi:transcriptional regulator with GAF, ATPase, and Fis domain
VNTEQSNHHHPESVGLRTVLLASADATLRARLRESLIGLRWQVREASGGAEALAQLEESRSEALLLDNWLPDLDITEFYGQVKLLDPAMDLLRVDGGVESEGARSPRRNELLHALREAQNIVAITDRASRETEVSSSALKEGQGRVGQKQALSDTRISQKGPIAEMIGQSPSMFALARLIRLVAPRTSSVLIEGETGTGKEIVAQSLHRLSARSSKSFAVLNCAAIPESLLEAELFGHTRGAFTGAVQARTGRIEAAHGGTLFLDEIGEMPLALQAKMLRFLECGELQRVGDNETIRVDVRVIAATHQPLELRADEKTFRLDLYHRLAVFPIEVPPLRKRKEDIELLAEYFLEQLGRSAPRKRLSSQGLVKLMEYDWPGNVRELMHVLERATILTEEDPQIQATHIRFGRVN